MNDLIAPATWTALEDQDLEGTILILGAPDTGKTTLARYLFQVLCRRGRRVAYLDTDMGQSTLGLPSTLNVALAAEAGDDRFPPRGPRAAFFVGSTTPRGSMLPTVVGSQRLQSKALALGAEVIVGDTNGLVDKAQGGKALKEWKIELLAPSLVIALQRDREMEPLLWPVRRDRRRRLVELPVSPHAVERGRERRIARRRESLAAYFEGGRPTVANLRRMAVYDLEHLAPGALLALQDAEGLCLGLGVVAAIDRTAGTVTIHTPRPGLEGVASIRFGPARWDLVTKSERREP